MLRQGTYQVPTRGLLDAIYNSGALAIGYETDSQEVANLPGLTSATWPLCRTAFASRVTDNFDHRYRSFTATPPLPSFIHPVELQKQWA